MSLYRVGEVWYVDLPSKQGRVRKSAGTTDKKKAQAYHDDLKEKLWRQDKLGEKPPVKWHQAADKWLKVKERSMQERYLLAAMDIDPEDLMPLKASAVEGVLEGKSSGSWNRYLNIIVAIHNVNKIPPPEVKRKKEPAGRTRWLTAEEWAKLRKALDEESPLLRQCAEFTLATGLRENNVLGLTWDQIRDRHAWLHGDQMKGKAPLGVPLNDAAVAVLEERRGVHKHYVFGNPDEPLTRASNRAWYAARKKAKLKGVRWHDLRHTWASWAVMNGVPSERLLDLGGWKSPQMVRRYAHLSSEHLAAEAAKIKPVSLRYNAPKRAR